MAVFFLPRSLRSVDQSRDCALVVIWPHVLGAAEFFCCLGQEPQNILVVHLLPWEVHGLLRDVFGDTPLAMEKVAVCGGPIPSLLSSSASFPLLPLPFTFSGMTRNKVLVTLDL